RFIYGGPGEHASKHFGETDYTEPEVERDLDGFAMDRTEVSNAEFYPFAQLEKLTGYQGPVYPMRGIHLHNGDPNYPVSEINAFTAEAYCAYMGKHLPSEAQWVKAARGGLVVHGQPNPYPRRLYPWGDQLDLSCVNLRGDKD